MTTPDDVLRPQRLDLLENPQAGDTPERAKPADISKVVSEFKKRKLGMEKKETKPAGVRT
jgi:hypothetical protein